MGRHKYLKSFPTEKLKKALWGMRRTPFPDEKSVCPYDMNTFPPSYIVRLSLAIGCGGVGRSGEKSDWAIAIDFENDVWVVEDWKRYAWRVYGPPNKAEVARRICKKISQASSLTNQYLSEVSKYAVAQDEFCVSNNQLQLLNLYAFFREKAEGAYKSLEEAKKRKPATFRGAPLITDALGPIIRANKEIEAYTLASVVLYFSYTETIWDCGFALGERENLNYAQFARLSWTEKMKFVMRKRGKKWNELLGRMSTIRRQYRNTITHTHPTKFFLLPKFGLIPTSFHDLYHPARSLTFGMETETSREIFSTFDLFDKLMEEDGDAVFYYLYARSDLPIHFGREQVSALKKHMTSPESFTEELNRRIKYENAVANMDI